MKSKYCYSCDDVICLSKCKESPEYLSVYLIGKRERTLYSQKKSHMFVVGSPEYFEFKKGWNDGLHPNWVLLQQMYYIIMYYRGTNDIHHVKEELTNFHYANLRAQYFTKTTGYDACLEIDH